MKNTLKVAAVLTWFNMIFWSVLLGFMLLATLATGYFALLVGLFLLSSILLHSYAALQLYKSIRQPSRKLSSQTPIGIRFVGFVALFFGILFIINGFAVIQNAAPLLKSMRESFTDMKNADLSFLTLHYVQGMGIFVIVLGIIQAVGILLNLRLLRWYYLVRQSDAS